MTLDEIEMLLQTKLNERDEVIARYKEEVKPLIVERDRLVAEAEARRKLENMSDADKAAMAQILAVESVDSTLQVNM